MTIDSPCRGYAGLACRVRLPCLGVCTADPSGLKPPAGPFAIRCPPAGCVAGHSSCGETPSESGRGAFYLLLGAFSCEKLHRDENFAGFLHGVPNTHRIAVCAAPHRETAPNAPGPVNKNAIKTNTYITTSKQNHRPTWRAGRRYNCRPHTTHHASRKRAGCAADAPPMRCRSG